MHRYPTMTSWGPSDPPSGLCVTFFTKHFRLVISYLVAPLSLIIEYSQQWVLLTFTKQYRRCFYIIVYVMFYYAIVFMNSSWIACMHITVFVCFVWELFLQFTYEQCLASIRSLQFIVRVIRFILKMNQFRRGLNRWLLSRRDENSQATPGFPLSWRCVHLTASLSSVAFLQRSKPDQEQLRLLIMWQGMTWLAIAFNCY